MNRPQIIIAGGGIGGLVSSLILARYADVTLLERSSRCGGKARRQSVGSDWIDCGPTVFTMKWVFDSIFDQCGLRLEDELPLEKLDCLARHFWTDGTQLDLYADPARSAEAIASFSSPAEADRFWDFTRKSQEIFDRLTDSFMRAPKADMARLILSGNPMTSLKLKPFSTLWQALSEQFTDPRLQQLYGRYATYCGASPFEAPATLMLIAHAERVGVWIPEGGMAGLAACLERLARNAGVRIETGCELAEITLDKGAVCGVVDQTGKEWRADSVIFNGDVAALRHNILGKQARRVLGKEPGGQRSQSAVTFTVSAAPRGVELDAHNVFFSDDYRAEFDAVFKRGEMPKDPTTYLYAPDTDASGARSMFFLINAPANGDTHHYTNEEVEQCHLRMTKLLSRCGLTLQNQTDTLTATTPSDFAKRFPATGGALFGMAGHGWQSPFKRAGVRTKLPGLYLAGGSIHPGAGVPMAALSGQSAAMSLISDFDLTARSPELATLGGM